MGPLEHVTGAEMHLQIGWEYPNSRSETVSRIQQKFLKSLLKVMRVEFQEKVRIW